MHCLAHLPLLDVDISELSGLHDLKDHVTLPHEEELLALLQVVVLALVWASNVENLG